MTVFERWLESKKESAPLPIDQAHQDDLGTPDATLEFIHWWTRQSDFASGLPEDELHYVAEELGLSHYDRQRFVETVASWI